MQIQFPDVTLVNDVFSPNELDYLVVPMFPPTWAGREFVPGSLGGYMFRLVRRRLHGHLSAGEIYYTRGFARGLGRTSKMLVDHKYSRGR
jgi:hypothetical protein